VTREERQEAVRTRHQDHRDSADAGYCSEANLQAAHRRHVRAHIATRRQQVQGEWSLICAAYDVQPAKAMA